jgi:hypothetical protein
VSCAKVIDSDRFRRPGGLDVEVRETAFLLIQREVYRRKWCSDSTRSTEVGTSGRVLEDRNLERRSVVVGDKDGASVGVSHLARLAEDHLEELFVVLLR